MRTKYAPGVLVALTTVVLLAVAGVAPWVTAWYLVAFSWTTLLPGVLVARALRPTPPNLLSDLAFGATFGFVANLAAFIGLSLVGGAQWLIAWPLLVVALFVGVPKLRRCWRRPSYEPGASTLQNWLLATAIGWQLAMQGIFFFANTALPPSSTHWYPDNYYHLSLAAELVRQVPPTTPQVAGLPLLYYWLPHADIAAAHLTTGIDLTVIYGRLWFPLVMVVVLALTAAVARRNGGLVALLLSLGLAWQPLSYGFGGINSLALNSPTMLFSLLFVLLAIDATWTALADSDTWGALTQFAVSALMLTGTKVSGLPVIICGLLLALAVALLWQRRLVLSLVARLGLAVGAVFATSAWFMDNSPGSEIRLFNLLQYAPPWRELGSDTAGAGPSWLIPGLTTPGAFALLGVLIVVLLSSYSFVFLAWRRFTTTNLTAWFLLGIGISGWVAFTSIYHTGGSQAYFMMSAAPALFLLTGWGADEMDPAQTWRGLWLGVALVSGIRLTEYICGTGTTLGTVVGLFVALGVLFFVWRFVPTGLWLGLALGAFAPPLLADWQLLLGGLVLAGFFWWRPGLWHPVVVVLVAALFVGAIGATAYRISADTERPDSLTTDEVAAASWLRSHSGATDVVATNVHCTPPLAEPNCLATAFWLSGLSQRRVLVEGWAYTTAAHARNGVDGFPANRQPFDDAALFALNEEAFYAPTPGHLADLRARGVRWLFADAAAGRVSPVLADLAKPAFTTATVTVYDLGP